MSIEVIQGQMSAIVIDSGGAYNFTIELPHGVVSSQVVASFVYSRSVSTQVGSVNATPTIVSSWTGTHGVQFQGVTNLTSTTTDDLEIVVITTDDGTHVGFEGRIIQ